MADLAKDCSAILSGPSDIKIGADAYGHTQGGTKVTYEAKTRPVNVDALGETACNLYHTGDSLMVSTSLAQWASKTVLAAFASGGDGSADTPPKVGLGRLAGYIYTSVALDIVPLASAQAAKHVLVHRAVSQGQTELNFNNENDRVVNLEWMALADDTKADGYKIAHVFV